MRLYGVVYLIQNRINGKRYVGQTKKNVKARFNEHAHNKKSIIGKAINKYGKENFICGVIKSCTSKEEMNYWEKFFIFALKSKAPRGYNQTDGGEGSSGFKHTPEHNAKISAANKGIPKSSEQRAKLSLIKTLTAKRAYSPYSNLVALLAEHKISYTKLAKALEMTQEAMSYKMCGEHNFSLVQMEAIKDFLGVETPLCDLFRKADGSVPDLTPKTYVYPVLAAELQRRKITYKKLGETLGLDKSSIGSKMRGKVNFSPVQMKIIKEFLNVEISIEELFQRTDDFISSPCPSYIYPILAAELKRSGISFIKLSKTLGLSRNSISEKMRGIHKFSMKQKTAIKKFLNVEMSVEELFKRNE